MEFFKKEADRVNKERIGGRAGFYFRVKAAADL
jgi:hypothetical protein